VAIYTKGKLLVVDGVETYYVLVSSKRALGLSLQSKSVQLAAPITFVASSVISKVGAAVRALQHAELKSKNARSVASDYLVLRRWMKLQRRSHPLRSGFASENPRESGLGRQTGTQLVFQGVKRGRS
jgi:hypothetical protein